MQTDQIVTFIHTIPMFHWLEPEQLEQVARAATVREFSKGELLLKRDAEAHQLFIVVADAGRAARSLRTEGFRAHIAKTLSGEQYRAALDRSLKRRAAGTGRSR